MPKPGELITCELCGQQPESIAFDVDECKVDRCPFTHHPAAPAAPPQGDDDK